MKQLQAGPLGEILKGIVTMCVTASEDFALQPRVEEEDGEAGHPDPVQAYTHVCGS